MDSISFSNVKSEFSKSKDNRDNHQDQDKDPLHNHTNNIKNKKNKHSKSHSKKKDKEREEKRHKKRHKEIDNEIPLISSSITENTNSVQILQGLVKELPNYNLTGRLFHKNNNIRIINQNSRTSIHNDNNNNNNTDINSASQYMEPIDSSIPTDDWRLYKYENNNSKPEIYYISNQSCYRIGKSTKNNDLVLNNTSADDYHAVIQYKKKQVNIEGKFINTVKPYLIDLSSTNGTFINSKRILSLRPTELLESDIIEFALLANVTADDRNNNDDSIVTTQFILLKGDNLR